MTLCNYICVNLGQSQPFKGHRTDIMFIQPPTIDQGGMPRDRVYLKATFAGRAAGLKLINSRMHEYLMIDQRGIFVVVFVSSIIP
jgi:hypothetical protein